MSKQSSKSGSITSDTLSKVESYQYPRAHDGHLNDTQATALINFRSICEDRGYYKPSVSGQRASHDNETLLRYLRARKFSPEDAFVQFKTTEDWRKQNGIDKLYDTIDINEYDETRRLYPQWTGRRDKRGIPVYVFELAGLNSKRMSEYEKKMTDLDPAKSQDPDKKGKIPPKLKRLFALYENLVQFALPLCSGVPDRPFPDTPVSQSNNIVDVSGVGPKQFWNLKGHMQVASQLATAHYPETLDRIFIIGAPSFFPTVWGWVKRWFDPITVSKIFILPQHEVKSVLTQYVDISNIPTKYGGELKWTWGNPPSLEPSIQKAISWKNPSKDANGNNTFPGCPVRWREGSDRRMHGIALGTINGKQQEIDIGSLPGRTAGLTIPVMDRTKSALNIAPPAIDPLALDRPTTGIHTHPSEDQEYFPTSGNTPPTEPNEDSDTASDPSGTPAAGVMDRRAAPVQPTDDAGTRAGAETAVGADHTRVGTSETRFNEQNTTHAAGQLASETPVRNDYGDGDTTTTMEPSTVGQAPKNVEVPEAKPKEEPASPSYMEQAKAAAGSAASAVSAAGGTVLAKTGLGGQQAEDQEQKKEETAAEQKKEDPRVDSMPNNNVEDFIRQQYTTAKAPEVAQSDRSGAQ
ncbi:MAG: hypothetical protein M1828_003659 [Chrysothrix sp. TS-e1954]|nr:MAG: hypothetical protein M1828_003659 [Chrysothrix sp. TS-e1954]